MNTNEIDKRIGDAWQSHYDGQQDSAVQQFSQIVAEAPNHVDANWGLGLSYRKMGDKEKALKAFEKVRDLVTAQLDQLETDAEDYERCLMLQRMVKQQIEQISRFF
jgi:tetratricopeptide (TPR) repeat protein